MNLFSSALAVVVLSTMPAAAAEPSLHGGGFSIVTSLVQMAASLAVVVGMILLFHYFSRRWLKNTPVGSTSRYIRVVETKFLAPKKALVLVEVAGEYMLLSNCGDNLNLVKQVEMIEDVEVIGEAQAVSFREAFQEKLKGLTARLPKTAGCVMAGKSGARP